MSKDTLEQAGMTVEQAGKRLGICRNSAYEAVRKGEIPSIKIGGRYIVPIPAFEHMLSHPGKGTES